MHHDHRTWFTTWFGRWQAPLVAPSGVFSGASPRRDTPGNWNKTELLHKIQTPESIFIFLSGFTNKRQIPSPSPEHHDLIDSTQSSLDVLTML